MLGRVRRTTRTDVGLALAMSGIAYLVWVLTTGVARHTVNELMKSQHLGPVEKMPSVSEWLCNAFLAGGFVWDMVGVLWLVLTMALIIGSSRQRWIISWPWMSTVLQALVTVLLAIWSGLAGMAPYGLTIAHIGEAPYPTAAYTFMSLALAIGMLLWVTVLVWLLLERGRMGRGPRFRDGMRTHAHP